MPRQDVGTVGGNQVQLKSGEPASPRAALELHSYHPELQTGEQRKSVPPCPSPGPQGSPPRLLLPGLTPSSGEHWLLSPPLQSPLDPMVWAERHRGG